MEHLKNIDIVFLSDEDILGAEHFLEKIILHCSHVVCTHGADGVTIYLNGLELFFPAFPIKEVDSTGAGDAFTTAYLIDYYRKRDVRSACIFAHCAASFIVEGTGIFNMPGIEEVNQRKREYLNRSG